jgi:hypothetical protein
MHIFGRMLFPEREDRKYKGPKERCLVSLRNSEEASVSEMERRR